MGKVGTGPIIWEIISQNLQIAEIGEVISQIIGPEWENHEIRLLDQESWNISRTLLEQMTNHDISIAKDVGYD